MIFEDSYWSADGLWLVWIFCLVVMALLAWWQIVAVPVQYVACILSWVVFCIYGWANLVIGFALDCTGFCFILDGIFYRSALISSMETGYAGRNAYILSSSYGINLENALPIEGVTKVDTNVLPVEADSDDPDYVLNESIDDTDSDDPNEDQVRQSCGVEVDVDNWGSIAIIDTTYTTQSTGDPQAKSRQTEEEA
ncbi:unnamed protein product [Ilex paraguariensis]|uniref:Uncharacterized protein n=1 Tax=Ilex paraguariensis TaxID=185542 RepID=A0ABC8QUV4_9AQUA